MFIAKFIAYSHCKFWWYLKDKIFFTDIYDRLRVIFDQGLFYFYQLKEKRIWKKENLKKKSKDFYNIDKQIKKNGLLPKKNLKD